MLRQLKAPTSQKGQAATNKRNSSDPATHTTATHQTLPTLQSSSPNSSPALCTSLHCRCWKWFATQQRFRRLQQRSRVAPFSTTHPLPSCSDILDMSSSASSPPHLGDRLVCLKSLTFSPISFFSDIMYSGVNISARMRGQPLPAESLVPWLPPLTMSA